MYELCIYLHVLLAAARGKDIHIMLRLLSYLVPGGMERILLRGKNFMMLPLGDFPGHRTMTKAMLLSLWALKN